MTCYSGLTILYSKIWLTARLALLFNCFSYKLPSRILHCIGYSTRYCISRCYTKLAEETHLASILQVNANCNVICYPSKHEVFVASSVSTSSVVSLHKTFDNSTSCPLFVKLFQVPNFLCNVTLASLNYWGLFANYQLS